MFNMDPALERAILRLIRQANRYGRQGYGIGGIGLYPPSSATETEWTTVIEPKILKATDSDD